MKRYPLAAFVFMMFAVAMYFPQCSKAQMGASKPGPELKKLDYFAGSWSVSGDMKPGPMGPGGKMNGTEHIEWMDGGFFLTSHSEFKSAMGNATGIAMMGYNADDKVYTYDEYNSVGDAEHSKGTVDGDTWTWNSDERMRGMNMKSRFTMKILSPASYNFKYEMSQDGSSWTTMMDGTATKGK